MQTHRLQQHESAHSGFGSRTKPQQHVVGQALTTLLASVVIITTLLLRVFVSH
ncbi:BQ5605_C001g00607 [Microbotryum silenes-dioicae]|uniref:BQ5605_C001g00607 protein n=1 Tax=Microbotryum silenes-dioicae TaxID=796604 RepID=A0A2X0M7Y2_9BASI|nr:BQ5605_C001g00607 [Microbotryum silenes-dioicae]